MLGSGPASVHFVGLCCFSALEACDVVLVESLVNRGVLGFLKHASKLKYVGRPAYCSGNSFYGVLLNALCFGSGGLVVVWVKNGDALVYNRGWCANTFLSSFELRYFVLPGVTCAMAALAVNRVSASSKSANDIVLSVRSDWHKLALGSSLAVLVVYMARLNAIAALDLLICAGAASGKVVMLLYAVSSSSQSVVYSSLNACLFSASGCVKAPCVVVLGESVCYQTCVNWIRVGNDVDGADSAV
ncbi:SAM-dependent methyltransferase [Candidatus Hodgkinia cicadicola]